MIEPHSISAGLIILELGLCMHICMKANAVFVSATDKEALSAAFGFEQIEGIIPALESAHALHALKMIRFKKMMWWWFCFERAGDKDLETYMKFI